MSIIIICLLFIIVVYSMDSWHYYIQDTVSGNIFVLNVDFTIELTLQLSMNQPESLLLPPLLQIQANVSRSMRTIPSEELNSRYKYVYVCHMNYFLDYKVFYMKGMVHIYCIDDVRFLEKSKSLKR